MDQNLTQLRDQIDGIDQKLVELFKQRMAVSRQVAAYKQEHGLPTLDVSRERALLAKVGSLAAGPALRSTRASGPLCGPHRSSFPSGPPWPVRA